VTRLLGKTNWVLLTSVFATMSVTPGLWRASSAESLGVRLSYSLIDVESHRTGTMARKPRVEYAGAFYHVICRGNQRQVIFSQRRGPIESRILLPKGAKLCPSVGGRPMSPTFRVSFFRPRNGLIPETETIFSPAATDFNVNHMRRRLAGLQSISLRCD
jgi:hypothetical protein